MKNIFALSLTILSLSFQTGKWQEFKHFEGKFRVLVPGGEMVQKKTTIKTVIGEIEYHQFIHRSKEENPDNIFYLVNYCDYPKGTFHPDSTAVINDFFEETVTSSAKSVSGVVSYVGDTHQQGYRGKVWRVQYNQDRVLIKSKCFLVGDRFYLLQTMTLKDKSLNLSADKFLESFYVF